MTILFSQDNNINNAQYIFQNFLSEPKPILLKPWNTNMMVPSFQMEFLQ